MKKHLFSFLMLLFISTISWGFNVTFKVDMTNVTGFTTANVNGTFNNWCGGCAAMTDANSDNIWEITIDLPAGTYEYKFTADGWNQQENLTAGSACTVTNFGYTNRTITVTGDTVLPTVCWGACSSCTSVYPVTFKVDMANVTAAYTQVQLAGSFNGWNPPANPMTDANSDGVYETTISLAPGTYEYKFAADNWNVQENLTAGSSCTVTNFGYTNRTITVTNTGQVMDPVCWGACVACNAVLPSYNVTFKVDMTQTTGFTTPELNGTFNNWCGNCTAMTDANADGIWEVTVTLQAGTYEYKFSHDNWGGSEQLTEGSSCTVTNGGFTNRTLTVTGNTTLDPVCYASCSACIVSTPGCTNSSAANYDPAANVDNGSCLFATTFNVDMSCSNENYTTVHVTGPWCGWCGGESYNTMSDTNNDGIYTVVVNLPAGNVEYKYMINGFASQENLIDDMQAGGTCATITDYWSYANRQTTAGSINNNTYGSCTACAVDVPGCNDATAVNYNSIATVNDGSCLYATTFNVDMTCAGSFTNVYVTGPWCGWCGADTYNLLTDGNSDGIYNVVVNLAAGNVEYKYMVDNWASQENLVDDMQNGGTCAPVTDYANYANRQGVIGSTFNDVYGRCTACQQGIPGCNDAAAVNYNPIATYSDGSCLYATTFNVDMSCAGVSFSNVYITGPWCGWCGADSYNHLVDGDADGIYTVVVNLPAGNVEYKYMVDNWASQENLVDDMQNGGTCAPVTDYANYANRQSATGTIKNDVYGSCSSCCLNLTYYADADGDGQGAGNAQILCAVPTSGYSVTGGDCNDANASINGSATEVCGNAIDENCDGIAATCGDDYNTPVVVASMNQFGVGTQTSFTATLGLSSDSPETSFSGNDRWFKFTATANAVRIAIAGSSAASDDNKIAIYDYVANPTGSLIPLAEEDDVQVGNQGIAADAGNEVLLYDGLVVGNQYMVAIANTNNSADNVTVTMSRLSASNPDIALYTNYTNTYTSTCQSFKAAYKPSAVAYIVNRWAGANVSGTPEWSYTIGGTTNTTVCQLGKIVVPNFSGSTQTIYVSVDVTYSLKDAFGNTTLVTAISGTTQSFGLADEAALIVRTYDQCPAYKNALSGSIATNRSVCGVSRYNWQFTQQVPVVNLPVSVEGALGGSRILGLSSVPGMANGQRYDVDIKVKHVDNATYSDFDGTVSCVRTLGAAGMDTEENASTWNDEARQIKLYPNPSNGNTVNVSLAGFEGQVNMDVFDYTGKKVNATTLNVDGSLQQSMEWSNDLSAGMYQVIFTNGTERIAVTMMIFK